MTTDVTSLLSAGVKLPRVELSATDGAHYDLSALSGITVVYGYPRTSPPNAKPLPGWDDIPGARGCTPQSCAFRDHYDDLKNLGVANVFGLSVQDSAYQSEVVERLHLPFALLSDVNLTLARSLGLQTFTAGGMELLQRITLIVRDGVLAHVMFPVREPEQNAADVVAWLKRYGSGL